VSELRASIIKRLQDLADIVPEDTPEEFWQALSDVVSDALTAFGPPQVVVVGYEHMSIAVGLATAYLEADTENRLLAELLADVEDRMATDPAFRLGVVGALGQIVADCLTATVLASAARGSADDTDDGHLDLDEIDLESVREASRAILQRIVIARSGFSEEN
jgi:hypothetical protein